MIHILKLTFITHMYRNICISILNLGKNLLQPTADADGLSGQPALFSLMLLHVTVCVMCSQSMAAELLHVAYSNPYTSQAKFNTGEI